MNNTPQPSASGAHTRIRLSRLGIEIHGTLNTFNRHTGDFTAFLDIDPQGTAAESFTAPVGNGKEFTDSEGLFWTLVGYGEHESMD
jgi:hypothetical protein